MIDNNYYWNLPNSIQADIPNTYLNSYSSIVQAISDSTVYGITTTSGGIRSSYLFASTLEYLSVIYVYNESVIDGGGDPGLTPANY